MIDVISTQFLFKEHKLAVPTQDEVYQSYCNKIIAQKATVVVFTRTIYDNKEALLKQEEIFKRLSEKLPQHIRPCIFINSHLTVVDINKFTNCTSLRRILLVDLLLNYKLEKYKSLSINNVEAIRVDDIFKIDSNSELKKNMWMLLTAPLN